MRVLVSCEFTGRVRDAFIAKGHDAVSCDILPTELPGPHIQDDVLAHLCDGWDMMIGHPPCTFLANSGVRWLSEKPGRWEQMREAADFFNALWHSDIDKVCIENPIPHKWATERIGRYSQCIQPWHYGHKQKKTTCLWLRNLPLLLPENVVGPPPKGDKSWEMIWREPPGVDQAKNRSRTFEGIARAMANQWG